MDLDEACSRHFRYRDFIECSETWQRLSAEQSIDNVPRSPATLRSMRELATMLDRVVDEFGSLRITYGFASTQLTRAIAKGIAPRLDQHAGSELKKDGSSVCARGGLAVDIVVDAVRTSELASWLSQHVPYDRMYLYGDDRPVHLSIAAKPLMHVYWMRTIRGKRIPRQIRVDEIGKICSQPSR